MYLDGVPSAKLGTLSDQLRLTVWYRREQQRIFETMINLYANVISINPDISKKVEKLIGEYLENVVPGTEEMTKKETASTIKAQGEALQSIFKALQGHNQRIAAKKRPN